MAEEFDWSNKENIVVPRQGAVAVYLNPNNDLVIREDGEMQDDHYVVISRQHVNLVLKRHKGADEGVVSRISIIGNCFRSGDANTTRRAVGCQLDGDGHNVNGSQQVKILI